MTRTTDLVIGRVTIAPNSAHPESSWPGRFGGGWERKLGLQRGSKQPGKATEYIVSLWTRAYRVTVAPRRPR